MPASCSALSTLRRGSRCGVRVRRASCGASPIAPGASATRDRSLEVRPGLGINSEVRKCFLGIPSRTNTTRNPNQKPGPTNYILNSPNPVCHQGQVRKFCCVLFKGLAANLFNRRNRRQFTNPVVSASREGVRQDGTVNTPLNTRVRSCPAGPSVIAKGLSPEGFACPLQA